MMLCLQIASPSLALLSLLLLLAALGSDHWLLTKENQVLIHSGLWKYCMNLRCLIPLTVPDLMRASRACLILAVIAGFLSYLALLASSFRSHLGSVSLTLVSAVGSFSAGLCATVAMAMFTSQSTKAMTSARAGVSFGWSYGLGWAACPLSPLANYIEATKTFLTLGLLAGLLSAFSLLALLSGSDFDAVSPLVVSTMGSFSAGFCVLIALTVFTSEFPQVIKATWPHISFGWSWGLGWASIPLFLLTGGVTLLAQESNLS